MIGISGKSIRPKVYIGIGISGATHHLCGVQHAETIIGINIDANAEIFQQADYKIVAQSDEVINALIQEIKKL